MPTEPSVRGEAPGAHSDAGDPYALLAAIYDEWQAQAGSFWRRVLPRLLAAVELHSDGRGVASFGDFGCGTGTLMHGLAQRKPLWRLHGVDRSAAMLIEARRRPGPVRWSQADFATSWSDAPLDAAGIFFDGLNHVSDQQALVDALAGTATALRPGGLLLFDVTNQVGFHHWWRGRRVVRTPRFFLDLQLRFDPAQGRAHAVATVEPWAAGVKAGQVELTQTCFAPPALRDALEQARLQTLVSEPWAPTPGDVPGKTWYVVRRR